MNNSSVALSSPCCPKEEMFCSVSSNASLLYGHINGILICPSISLRTWVLSLHCIKLSPAIDPVFAGVPIHPNTKYFGLLFQDLKQELPPQHGSAPPLPSMHP